MTLPRVSLSDAYWFQEGPGVRNWQFAEEGVKLLNVANIRPSGTLDLSKTSRHLTVQEVNDRYTHFLADAGDLVMASSGISLDADELLRTRSAFVEAAHLPLCMNTSTIRFKAKSGISDLNFLKHWLQSDEFRIQITKEVTGIAQKNFGPSHLNRLRIVLPRLEEQRRIAAILDKTDTLRAKRREAIAKLDQLLQSVFLDMFGDPITNPKEWPIHDVGDAFVDFIGGKNVACPDESVSPFRILKVSAVTSGFYRSSESKPAPDDFRPTVESIVQENELLFSRANTEDLVAATAYVWQTPKNLVLPDKLWKMRIREISELKPLFALALFQNKSFRNQLSKRSSGTSGSMKNISKEKLRSMPMPIPPAHSQQMFVEFVNKMQEQRQRLVSSQMKIDLLNSALQAQNFSA